MAVPIRWSLYFGLHQLPKVVLTTEARVVMTSSSPSKKDSCYIIGQYPATIVNIFFNTVCCSFLYSYSIILSLSHSFTRVSVVKVILVCLAVRNLQPVVSFTLLMAYFLQASNTYLQVEDTFFYTQVPRCSATTLSYVLMDLSICLISFMMVSRLG